MPDQLKIIQRPFDAFLSNAEIVELQKRYDGCAVSMRVMLVLLGKSSGEVDAIVRVRDVESMQLMLDSIANCANAGLAMSEMAALATARLNACDGRSVTH